jgi:hypothetical protein
MNHTILAMRITANEWMIEWRRGGIRGIFATPRTALVGYVNGAWRYTSASPDSRAKVGEVVGWRVRDAIEDEQRAASAACVPAPSPEQPPVSVPRAIVVRR